MAEPAQWAVRVTWEGDGPNEAYFRQQFYPFGAVYVFLETTEPENSKRSAFIYFRTQQEAQKAQDNTDGNIVEGSVLEVVVVPPPSSINRSYLIIRNVSSSFTQRTSWLTFLTFNPKSCEVKYNQYTQQNEAHIQFYYEEDAQEAIQHLNGKMIQGQKIEIEFQSIIGRQSPPPQNKPRPPLPIPQQPTQEEDEKILYITNLNSRTSQQDLELVFLGFNVARLRIIPGQSSTQPSSAEVHLLSSEDAHQALMHSIDIKIDGNTIGIRYNKKKPIPDPNQTQQSGSTLRTSDIDKKSLFINYLNPTTTNQSLYEAFEPFNVINCNIPPNQKSTAIHGYANFSNEIDSQNALENLNGKKIDGSKVKIKYKQFIPPPPQNNKREIQIKNLDPSTNKRTLELIFKPFSPIDINMNSPQSGQAQIKFTYDEDGEEAIQHLNGRMIEGKRISIEFQQILSRQSPPPQSNPRPPLQIPQQPTQDEETQTLIITNIDPIITNADMELIFMAYNIEKFNIKPLNSRFETRKGEAFFNNWEDAKQALIHVDGQRIDRNILRVQYKKKGNNKGSIQ
ncbi:MAG: hypothetical protein EZS28_001944 [Streblomastix strix]|uniref:RRM domain-containing protein n=1 Tax=Streblomastix strix TaxID=222440 RepID=A0A5J4X6Z4_9EUKA|nr:MAG: hypothetical protein EZS28_001944 [Streblomastix strix]